ncbi:hypothetical protein GUITHDRAFT_73380, partial [Guillardia theta CCMP2712]
DVNRVFVKGGDGGNGEVAFRREAHVDMGGPFGGNGGNGGDVIFVADEGDNTLAHVRSCLHIVAECGRRGQGKGKDSPAAPDTEIRVPLGTIVRDAKTGVLIGDLRTPGQKLVVARGGLGGRGNLAMRTERDRCPGFAELGEKATPRWVDLQLKMIADIGIVGMPNAGKSSLLASITNAKPKIADYPFTTIVPNLGVCLPGAERRSIVLADIPGLIEGAHNGIGLGQAFLRHVERCRILLHVIDGSSEDPIKNFNCIQNELKLFSPKLAAKPQVILINKMDLPSARERWPTLQKELQEQAGHKRIDAISAATSTNIMPIMVCFLYLPPAVCHEQEKVRLRSMLDKMPPAELDEELQEKTEEEIQREEALMRVRGVGRERRGAGGE